MSSARFGTRADGSRIGRFDDDNDVFFATMHAKNLSYVNAHLTLREAYDLTFGISTEGEYSSDPLSVMKMHPHEDYVTDGAIMSLMNRIINAKLPSTTNMSLVELMELPVPYLEHLLTVGQKSVDGENEAAKKFLDGLEE